MGFLFFSYCSNQQPPPSSPVCFISPSVTLLPLLPPCFFPSIPRCQTLTHTSHVPIALGSAAAGYSTMCSTWAQKASVTHTHTHTPLFSPFTPAFIYLHRSPAAAPFILAFSSSRSSSSSVPPHLLPCSGSSLHPSQPTWMPTSFFLSALVFPSLTFPRVL